MRFGVISRISLRHLSSRPFQTFSVISVVALSTALAVVLFLLTQGLRQGLVRAVEPFDIIVSAKGSPYQLVLNTVFLQDAPVGNILWSDCIDLSDDARVESAVPMGFGDSYRGFPIVGTTREILRIRASASGRPWLRVRDGRWFEGKYEAVLGAQAASVSGLTIGGKFRTSHGLSDTGDEHDETYEVTGILSEVMGPYDRAIFVNIEDIWAMHKTRAGTIKTRIAEEPPMDSREATAVLVQPVSYSAAYNLAASYQRDTRMQLVFPAQAAIRLFSIMGRSENFMSIIVHIVSGFALLVTLLALYWSAADRRTERLLLHILGASRRDLIIIVWLEGTFLIMAGVIVGEILGRAGVYAIFRLLSDAAAIEAPISLTLREAAIPASILAIGSICSLSVTIIDRHMGNEPHIGR
ncbi:MAG: ABC transporter permease [Synergistaceae bacterium]|nr:ABC transporter permease [Synergistaceae bacterium]